MTKHKMDYKDPEDAQAEAAWWQEDADRLNKLGQVAKDHGKVIELDLGPPPELNEDGSLKEEDEPIENFDPRQVRDEKGRWSSTGASGTQKSRLSADGTMPPPAKSRFKHPVINPEAKTTSQAYMKPDGTYTKERQQLHQKITDEVLKGKTPAEHPVGILMGGGPAAGKSTIMGDVGAPKNLVTIAADDYKFMLPEYDKKKLDSGSMTHIESTDIAWDILGKASKAKYNTLLDGTGDGNLEALTEKVAHMKSGGQKVIAHYVTIDTETAMKRMKDRGKKTGRYVPEEAVRGIHSQVSRVLPQAIKAGLFDEFHVWDTGAEGKPIKIASGKKSQLEVHDSVRWQKFLDKGSE